jgi:hypothetical protein
MTCWYRTAATVVEWPSRSITSRSEPPAAVARVPAVEVAAPQVPALAAQEHVGLRRLGRVARQVLGQGLDHHGRQADRAAAGGALRRPDGEDAVDLQELLGHRDRAALQIDALAAQPGQLPPAQPTEGGHQVVLDLINESRP